MGEYADDKLSGISCSWCGVYFESPHGHPVVCHPCGGEFSNGDLEELGVGRATENEANGSRLTRMGFCQPANTFTGSDASSQWLNLGGR